MKIPVHNERKAISFMIGSAFTGAVVAASIKSLTFVMSPLIAFWVSRFFPLLGLIPMGLQGHLSNVKTKVFGKHLLLNVFYVSSILFYYCSLGKIPLVDASLLFNTAPLYAPVIALIFLRERVAPHLWWYFGLSFLGVILVLQPSSSLFQPISLLAAASGILMAASQVCNRHLSQTESHGRIVFYMIILAPILGTIPVLAYPSVFLQANIYTYESWPILATLVLAGISTWLYQVFRTRSAAHGRVAIVMPFSYLGVVFAGLFDWMFWGVIPNSLTFVGLALIFIGSILILRHSRKSV